MRMNKIFIDKGFDDLYPRVLKDILVKPDFVTTNRKGNKLHEFLTPEIIIRDTNECFAFSRNISMPYVIGELCFYVKGDNKTKHISKFAKMWKQISDDGVNLNSCYGHYIWKMKTPSGKSQMDYCIDQFISNEETKKAVMTIYEASKHSYRTKDNPCTMNLQFFIRDNKLDMIVNMRSNDLWYGLPYDVPFFTFIQKVLFYNLKPFLKDLDLGTYTHRAGSLHLYERNFKQAREALANPGEPIAVPPITSANVLNLKPYTKLLTAPETLVTKDPFFKYAKKVIQHDKFMKEAWKQSKRAVCLKKEVGCVYVKDNKVMVGGYGGRPKVMGACKVCVRKTQTFHQDGCNSVHSEYRAVFEYCKKGLITDFKGTTVYITHGPCDQCMKLLIDIGVSKVIFDVPYKISLLEKYQGIIGVEDKNGGVYTVLKKARILQGTSGTKNV